MGEIVERPQSGDWEHGGGFAGEVRARARDVTTGLVIEENPALPVV
jgi:hypothetical protein